MINDVYRPFITPDAPDSHHLLASRACVVALAVAGAIASFVVTDITLAWELALSVTAGLGSVFAVRWYWWRVNAWSELAAMGVAMIGSLALQVIGWSDLWPSGLPTGWQKFPFDAALLTAVSIGVWVGVTWLTPPCDREHLRAFYRKVRPGGPGWRAIAGDIEGFEEDGPGWGELVGFVGATALVFGALLGVGELLVGRPVEGALWLGVFAGGLGMTTWGMRRVLRRVQRGR